MQVIRRIGQPNNTTGLTRQGSSFRDFPPNRFLHPITTVSCAVCKKGKPADKPSLDTNDDLDG